MVKVIQFTLKTAWAPLRPIGGENPLFPPMGPRYSGHVTCPVGGNEAGKGTKGRLRVKSCMSRTRQAFVRRRQIGTIGRRRALIGWFRSRGWITELGLVVGARGLSWGWWVDIGNGERSVTTLQQFLLKSFALEKEPFIAFYFLCACC